MLGKPTSRRPASALLQVELVIPIEELDERFQKEHPEEEFDQVLWKNFWQKHARYRTICLNCISMRKEKERRAEMDEPCTGGPAHSTRAGGCSLLAVSVGDGLQEVRGDAAGPGPLAGAIHHDVEVVVPAVRRRQARVDG